MHDFVGRWQIVWLSTWPEKQANLKEAGYFKFLEGRAGEFAFGQYKGSMDVKVSTREPRLEYSWQGEVSGVKRFGRGWLEFDIPDEGEGILFVHDGSEVGIALRRKT